MRTFLSIFLCSASAISFEIVLTRIFSIALWHHFAFMVISIAMLGIGMSGTLQSIYPGLKKETRLGSYALLLAVSIPLSHVLTNLVPFDPATLQWDRGQLLYIAVYYVLLSVPFLFFGLIVATSFSAYSDRAGLVYGADMLGAGVGALSVILIMNYISTERTVILISFSALLVSFLLGKRIFSVIIAIFLVFFLSFEPEISKIRLSPYKELRQALSYPGSEHLMTAEDGYSRIDVIKSPMVRFAPGLSLNWPDPLPPQIGFTADGSGINAVTAAGSELGFLRHLPPALPYEMKRREKVLVMDPGGGLPVLLAREYGTEDILAIESNPLLIDVIRDNYGEFSGNIYAENTSSGLARNWLGLSQRENSENTAFFDVIDISMTSSIPSGPFGMAEDYGLTREAFVEYLQHLSAEGVLSVSLFILPPPRTELRLLLTGISALRDMGISDPAGYVAAVRSWGSIILMFKTVPFSEEELEKIRKFAFSNGFDPVYLPGMSADETGTFIKGTRNDYYQAFASLLDDSSRSGFVKDYIFDIRQTTDDRPYFHHYMRPSKLKAIYDVMGHKMMFFIQEGYLMPVIFVQAMVLSLLLLFLPGIIKRGSVRPSPDLAYFALLGLGFMFIEVPLIQKMILPFENPQRAVAIVLSSLLVSSGAGGLASLKCRPLQRPGVVLVLALLSAVYALFLGKGAGILLTLDIRARIFLSFFLMAPAGFLMGLPFPMGMRALGIKNHPLIPWAWAANGCFSVLAPIIAVMVSTSWGFSAVLLLGASVYGLAYVVGKKTLFENKDFK